MLPLISSLVEDSEDSVRVCLSEPISYVSSILAFSSDEAKEKIIPLFRAQAVDRSWRIRFKTAEKISDLTKTLKSDVIKSDVLPNFCLLLKDPELEVRIVAVSRLADFAKSLSSPSSSSSSETVVKILLPVVRDLAKDDNATFKEALAVSVLGLAGSLSKIDCTTHVLPFLLDFLSDKQEVEVRTAAICNLESIAKAVDLGGVASTAANATAVSRILAAITALSQDRQWRVRAALIEAVPFIAVRFGAQWFDEKLLALSMLWLVDVVYSVREAAILNLRRLAQAFGRPWMKASLIPRLIILTAERSYIHRETGLYALEAIAGLVGDDGLGVGRDGKEKDKDGILSTLIRLSRDPVPNVCFVAARTLRTYSSVVGSTAIKKEIKNALEKQLANDDRDVKFFAEHALDELK